MTTSGFNYLFKNARQLVSAPKLPAKKLANLCYNSMFSGCTSLTTVPDTLPATTLALACYASMFTNCTSLTQAPSLPATKLENTCYGRMFFGCTALTQAPELKATLLAEQCYSMMFQNCTSLEVTTFSGSCDGAELVVPNVSGTAPKHWNQNMFNKCKGKAANNIQLGGHYCIKEYIAPYTRHVTSGNFGTICLDREIKDMEGVDGLYKPATQATDSSMLYCTEVLLSEVKAGESYIFKADSDAVVFTLEGDAVATAVVANNMSGWLGDTVTVDAGFIAEHSDYSILGTPQGASEQQVVKLAVGSVLLTNCAMINLKTVPAIGAPSAPGRRMITFGRNVATGLMQNAECTMQSGKMMVNGQLVIIRDGKMYNAQGAVVEHAPRLLRWSAWQNLNLF